MKSLLSVGFRGIIVLAFCTLIPLSILAVPSEQVVTRTDNSDPVILDVTGEDIGMVPCWGRYVYFRLYKSGQVEYQTCDGSKTGHKMELAAHEFKISEKDTDEIIQLLEDSAFLNARDLYPRLVTYIDTFYRQTISYAGQKQKKEVIVENYSLSNKKDPNYYPGPIVKLMSRIDDLKDKDIRIRSRSSRPDQRMRQRPRNLFPMLL